MRGGFLSGVVPLGSDQHSYFQKRTLLAAAIGWLGIIGGHYFGLCRDLQCAALFSFVDLPYHRSLPGRSIDNALDPFGD